MGSDDAKAEEWQESWAEDILDGLIQSLILVKDPYNQFSSSHDSKIPKALDFGWAAFWVQSAAQMRNFGRIDRNLERFLVITELDI